jgi:hypothetical protein
MHNFAIAISIGLRYGGVLRPLDPISTASYDNKYWYKPREVDPHRLVAKKLKPKIYKSLLN